MFKTYIELKIGSYLLKIEKETTQLGDPSTRAPEFPKLQNLPLKLKTCNVGLKLKKDGGDLVKEHKI